ncbi:MAG: hypothetical protein HC896_15835 [Bacteroidales bacterium]|nr:hypothetical protein [Bacteroidales bacterium]
MLNKASFNLMANCPVRTPLPSMRFSGAGRFAMAGQVGLVAVRYAHKMVGFLGKNPGKQNKTRNFRSCFSNLKTRKVMVKMPPKRIFEPPKRSVE